MTAKKYQFYIDSAPQQDFLQKSTIVKKLSLNDKNLLPYTQEIDELISHVTNLEMNSKNTYFKNFCRDNNISENLYNKIIRKYDKILLTFWGVTNLNDLESYNFFTEKTGLFRSSYEENLKKLLPFIIKFEDVKFINYSKIINYGTDLVLSEKLIENFDKTGLKYRIYINDRLLIERFYPEDLPLTKILCEESILGVNEPVKIKLVSNYNLVFTKIVVNNKVIYPNSIEFLIEP